MRTLEAGCVGVGLTGCLFSYWRSVKQVDVEKSRFTPLTGLFFGKSVRDEHLRNKVTIYRRGETYQTHRNFFGEAYQALAENKRATA